MLPTGHLLAFVLTAAVVIAVPGPSVLFTVGRALTIGKRGALLTVLGNAIGMYGQVTLVAFGLAAVVERSATAYTALKIAGAGYLIYLGVHAIVHRRVTATALATRTTPAGTLTVLRQGVVVGLTNPKMIVFLTAAMPQFVEPAAGNVPAQILLLGLLLVVLGLAFDSTWAFAAGAARDWFARSPGRIEAMSGSGGVAMIGLGASFLLLGHDD